MKILRMSHSWFQQLSLKPLLNAGNSAFECCMCASSDVVACIYEETFQKISVMRLAVHRHWQQDWMSSCDLLESVPGPINLLLFWCAHPACCFCLLPYASCLLLQLPPLSKAANELHVLHSWEKKKTKTVKNLSICMVWFCFLFFSFS